MENNNKKDSTAATNNKSLLYAGIAIIVVIAIALIVPHLKKSTPAVSTTTPVTTTDTTTTSATTPDKSMAAWNAMYQKYDGKLVVFAEDCTSTPVTQTQKEGTTVLLMNNSAVSHTITAGKDVYTIGAYHYKTTYLGTKGTIAIGCDKSTDSTNIVVN